MSSRTTTTTSNTQDSSIEPWGPLQAPLKKTIDKAMPMIGNAAKFRPPEPAQYKTGLNMLDFAATNANGGQDYFRDPTQTSQQFQPLMAGGQFDAARGAGALSSYVNNRNQSYDPARAAAFADYQRDYANPYLNQVISDVSDDVMTSLKSQFSGAGRSMGSGAFANVAADRLGRMANQMRYQDYDRQRQMFDAEANRKDQQGFAAAQNLYGTGIQTVLNAAPTADRMEQQRRSEMEQTYANRANQMLRQADLRRQLELDQTLYPELQSLEFPMRLLSNPNQSFRTGTTTSTNSQTQPNTGFLGGLGQIGLGIGSLFL